MQQYSEKNLQLALVVASAATCLLLEEGDDYGNRRSVWIQEWRKNLKPLGETLSLAKELGVGTFFYKNFLRMDENLFKTILEYIRGDIEKKNTRLRNAITAEERLAVTMRYLATGEYFTTLQYDTRLSRQIISAIVIDVCSAIYRNMKAKYLKFPTKKEGWVEIAEGYKHRWQFPLCMGSLDGKHIAFKPNRKDANLYYNYKGFHSIVLLALADAHARFIFIDVGCNGRISDGGVLQRSDLMKILQNSTKYFPPKKVIGNERLLTYTFVADNAFPLMESMMTPYPFTSNEQWKQVYNRRLSRARQNIERAFGIISGKFQVLQKGINVNQDKARTIVQCCCVLHNFLITHSDSYSDQYDAAAIQENETNNDITQIIGESGRAFEGIRHEWAEYFNIEGRRI